jgi:hypothetical protein|tara:strand:+ start:152 stop:619 length:468 start_codon:yes stop_codon:yes gene_type:complete
MKGSKLIKKVIKAGNKKSKVKATPKEKVVDNTTTGLPKKFRETVLGDADIQGTGAPQYERLKKTLGSDKAHEVIDNLRKNFQKEARRAESNAYKSKETRMNAIKRVYSKYGMMEDFALNFPVKKSYGGTVKKKTSGTVKKKTGGKIGKAPHNRLY